MKRPRTVALAALGVIFAFVAIAAPAAAQANPGTGGNGPVQIQSGHGEGWYGVWATSVAVRADSSEQCALSPSPSMCPIVRTRASAPEQVYVYCQQPGGTVGGNPYWVWVWAHGFHGYMASYYTDNASNWIDGVPLCY